jgi:hypothetical protein
VNYINKIENYITVAIIVVINFTPVSKGKGLLQESEFKGTGFLSCPFFKKFTAKLQKCCLYLLHFLSAIKCSNH